MINSAAVKRLRSLYMLLVFAQPSSAPPTPTRLTGANSDVEEEERGDLIQFYNNIYIRQMKTFAMKYSQANAVSLRRIISYFFFTCEE